MPAPVQVTTTDRVTTVAIDRPHRRNSVDLATADALYAAFKTFDQDETADVAILTGTGGAFCAGADLKALAGGEQKPVLAKGDRAPMGPTRLAMSKPVIAAIEGPAVAGGLELALWCDLRIAGASAFMGVFNRRFGVPLIDMGTLRLPRIIGQGRALDLILTGRRVDMPEAHAIGLVNEVVEDGQALSRATALARSLTAFPQGPMRGDRLSALQQWGLDEQAAIENEIRLGLPSVETGTARAGAARFASGEGRHGAFE